MRVLRGKTALVTGGGSGIGRAIATALAAEGATVAIADLDLSRAESAGKQITELGAAASAHQVDVASEEQFRALQTQVHDAHKTVDIVVNNAGIVGAPSDFATTSLDDVRRLLAVNLFGVIYGTAVFLPELLDRPRQHW